MDTNFEQIVPWNGAQDTGKDVRLKWQRNFDRIKANFEELTDLFEKVNLGTDEAPAWAIRAKYGLYTDSWISAKGKNPAAGSTPVAGATELSKLTDVLITTPADGQVLAYDTALGKWVNSEPVAGGLDVEELAEYLTNNNYAKKTDITAALSGYATTDWADGRYFRRKVSEISDASTDAGDLYAFGGYLNVSGGNSSFPNEYGILLNFALQDNDYRIQLYSASGGVLYFRTRYNALNSNWARIITSSGVGASGTWGIGITGNAGTATKLQTARTLWGRPFDGTKNVSGALTGVTDITA